MGFRDPYFLYIILCNQKEVKQYAHYLGIKMMFFKMCEKFITGTQCILIDDLVERDSFQVERLNNGVSIALFNPKDL